MVRAPGRGFSLARLAAVGWPSCRRPCVTPPSTSSGGTAHDALREPGLDRDRAALRPAGRLRFVLGLHESSVVGMATGCALGPRRARARDPAHDRRSRQRGQRARHGAGQSRAARDPRRAAGPAPHRLRAVPRGAAAGARRRLPGLGRSAGLQAQSVPASIARAYHEAVTGRGPALVIVPMDDWAAEATRAEERQRRDRWCAPGGGRPGRRRTTRGARRRRGAPALVAGAGVDDEDAGRPWSRSRSVCRAPSGRSRSAAARGSRRITGCSPATSGPTGARLRQALAPYDLVIAVGAPAFRQYAFSPGPFVEPGTRVVVVSQDPAEVHRSTADLARAAPPAAVCAALAGAVPAREAGPPEPFARPEPPEPPARGAPLRAGARLRRARRAAAAATRS